MGIISYTIPIGEVRLKRPVYAVGNALYRVLNEGNGEKHIVEAQAIFPTTDPAVKDRAERDPPSVNQATSLYVFWNLAGIIGNKNNLELFSREITKLKSLGPVPPDRNVNVTFAAQPYYYHSDNLILVKYNGSLALDNRILVLLEGKGIAKKLVKTHQ